MATFKLEPGAEVSGTGDGGETIAFEFDKKGEVEVPDDFQEGLRILLNAGLKPVKTSKAKE